MLKSSEHRHYGLCGVAGAVAAAAVGLPALAQEAGGGFTVIGSHRHAPDEIAASVSYSDLDLSTSAGRATLHHRVRMTARDLCRRIGEDHIGGSVTAPSCEDMAMLGAEPQERAAVAGAQSRTYAGAAPAGSLVLTMVGDGR